MCGAELQQQQTAIQTPLHPDHGVFHVRTVYLTALSHALLLSFLLTLLVEMYVPDSQLWQVLTISPWKPGFRPTTVHWNSVLENVWI